MDGIVGWISFEPKLIGACCGARLKVGEVNLFLLDKGILKLACVESLLGEVNLFLLDKGILKLACVESLLLRMGF